MFALQVVMLCVGLSMGNSHFEGAQSGGGQTPTTSSYPVFETDKLPNSLYRERRERLKEQLGPNAAAFIVTNPEQTRSNDTAFRFRPDSNFSYLTGFDEPDAALLLVPGGIELNGKRVTEVLFVNTSNPMSETWLGYRMGPVNAVPLVGVEAAVPNSALADVLAQVKATEWAGWSPPEISGLVAQMSASFTKWHAGMGERPKLNLNSALARMRVKKSPAEIALLQKAVDASVLGHAEAMRSTEPGMREYELQAVVEYIFTRKGCEFQGYNSIVGSGPNSCILHYETNRRQMKAGDMICMDVAGEYHGYSADVTRSFPVSGKFTPAQKAIYELVLAAQDAGIKECRVGQPFSAPHVAAEAVLTEGMIKLGIIKKPSELSRYFMHGTSHYIGLDVHDAHGDNTLREGYTLTVEPGIYIRPGAPCDPKWWSIGVRIEDDILVTAKGPVNMSGALPRKTAAIEALMAEKGIGNFPVRAAKP